MRAVLDTNVFISGIHWPGESEEVLRHWFLGRFELISSMPIIDEIIDTLMSFEVPMNAEDISWWKSLLVEKSVIVSPKESVNVVTRDTEDNKFIEAALEGHAEYIVSLDKDLLDIGTYSGIKILKPNAFLGLLK